MTNLHFYAKVNFFEKLKQITCLIILGDFKILNKLIFGKSFRKYRGIFDFQIKEFIPLGGNDEVFPYRGPRIFIGGWGWGWGWGWGQKGSLIFLKLGTLKVHVNFFFVFRLLAWKLSDELKNRFWVFRGRTNLTEISS